MRFRKPTRSLTLSLFSNLAKAVSGPVTFRQFAASLMICLLVMPYCYLPALAATNSRKSLEETSTLDLTKGSISSGYERIAGFADDITKSLRSIDEKDDENRKGDGVDVGDPEDKESAGAGTDTGIKNGNQPTNSAAVNRSMVIMNQLPADEQPSLFYPENNLGAPAGRTEQSAPNPPVAITTTERNGIGNFSFQVGFASLPGRGIDAGAGAVYNSRVWNKSTYFDGTANVDRYTYNVDNNWLAPGFSVSFGNLEGTGQTPQYLVDSSGNRHKVIYAGTSGSKTFYDANDGSFIRVTVDATANRQRTYARFSDGSTTYYDYYADSNGHRRPTMQVDSNGNYFAIAYVVDGNTDRITYLQDTLGRKIKFYYDPSNQHLLSVTVPQLGSTTNPPAETETIRFYYKTVSLNPGFAGTVDAPASVDVLEYVYYPGTKSGYKYEYASGFGMVYKISRFEGMTLTSDKSAVSSEGEWAAFTEYGFDLTGTLSDVPKYSIRTDDWAGRTSASAPVTQFSSVDDTTNQITTSTITSPDGTVIKTILNKKTNQSAWDNGLIKETSVTDSSAHLMRKSSFTWDPLSTSNPRLTKVENTNAAGQVNAITYDSYDPYNNVTAMSVHDFAAAGTVGAELKKVVTTYESGNTDPGWINRRLVHLPLSVKVYQGSTVVARTEYQYDYNGDQTQLINRGAVTGHLRAYNPNLPPLQSCTGPDDPGKITCITFESYDSASDYRGNVTKVTKWADPSNESDPLAETNVMKYDVLGNLIEATVNCCQRKQWVYDSSKAYTYPTEIKSGANGELIQSASYDFSTGAVLRTTDENGQFTDYEYEPETLRQKKVTYPNGAYTETFYSDTDTSASQLIPGYVKTKSLIDDNKLVESYGYFDGRGLTVRNSTQTTNGWTVSAVEYDDLGRPVKSYNPFNSSDSYGTPGTTPYTEVLSYDGLGRPTQTQLQDGISVYSYFEEASAAFNDPYGNSRTGTAFRSRDQADKERRQVVDALGRVIRVDELTANGLGTVNSPSQATHYYYDGNDNLSKVLQCEMSGSACEPNAKQERVFKYDSLSRLVAERQVEATATLNDNGDPGTLWTKVLKYDDFGRLAESTDARGVKTQFTLYDNLNRIKTVQFTDGTPQINYYYDEARGSTYYNKGRLTRVETLAGDTTLRPDTPSTATEFDYDKMGNVAAQRQWIGTQQYNLGYEYTLAGQLYKETYPSGRVVVTDYDDTGRLDIVKDTSRTYLSGMEYLGKANSVSKTTLGNGTIQNITLNDRLQLNSQELRRGMEILQKYTYGYGDLNSQSVLKNNGKLASVTSQIGSQTQWTQNFTYDSIGRLKQSEEKRGDNNNLSYKQVFDYDRFGNLYRKAANNPSTGQENPLPYTPIEETTTPGTGDISKLTNRFNPNTVYDAAGNVTQDNKFRGLNLSYDANGRVYKTSNTSNSGQSNSVYDASGQRVATQIDGVWTFYVYDIGGKCVAEYGGQQSTDEGGVKYVLQDWQGSSRALISNSGFTQARTDYTAFGEEINAGIGQRTGTQGFGANNTLNQKYALTERDKATGLDHTWYRKNEIQAGRWTGPDLYNGSMNLNDPQSINRYSYVTNQPTNFVDPSGLNMGSISYACYDLNTYWHMGETQGVFTTTICSFFGNGGASTGTSDGAPAPSGGGGTGTRSDNPNCITNAVANSRVGTKRTIMAGGRPAYGNDGQPVAPYGTDLNTNSHDGIHLTAPQGRPDVLALPAMAGRVLHYGAQVNGGPEDRSVLDIQLNISLNGDPFVLTLKDMFYTSGRYGSRSTISPGRSLGRIQTSGYDSGGESGLHVTLMTRSTYDEYIAGRNVKNPYSSRARANVPYNLLIDAANDPRSPFRCP